MQDFQDFDITICSDCYCPTDKIIATVRCQDCGGLTTEEVEYHSSSLDAAVDEAWDDCCDWRSDRADEAIKQIEDGASSTIVLGDVPLPVGQMVEDHFLGLAFVDDCLATDGGLPR